MTEVSVAAVLEERTEAPDLELAVLAGRAGLDRRVTLPQIQKTGLALAGYDEFLHAGRVLVFGESEIRYLEGLAPAERRRNVRRIAARDVPCVVVAGGLVPPPELADEADRAGLPLLATPAPTPVAIARLTARLEALLAVRGTIHGVLLDILGLGVLVIGESGIGKSECALDLVVRGHRLVADDAVEVRRRAETILIGTSPALTRH
ncbi:MAG TPA: hypothetical protein VNI83_14055, partial [Vicinamibacterales bacterium]|nr:hypothetical protein [Vicinamibacterales bacterium]